MTASPEPLLKLILDSHALSIWNQKTGPVFWYAAGVPGPFYLNTELMIGRAVAEKLLERITSIIAATPEPEARAAQLQNLIMDAYRQNTDYQTVIGAMIEKARNEFPTGSTTAVSGGERRDWLFSIPFAAETGMKHIYLFKNRTIFCSQSLQASEKTLHVSDLINNAASYFDLWLPILQHNHLACAGTLTVNTRGTNGLQRLVDAGCKVATLNRVDLSFFQKIHENGLIDRDRLDEITIYFASAKDWAEHYVMRDLALFDLGGLDKKSLERMRQFFEQDPWSLRPAHAAFFNAVLTAMAKK